MLNIIGLYIEINRGNAAGLTFHFDGDDAPEDGTEVIFRVTERGNADEPLIEKTVIEKTAIVADSQITVSFNPEDTEQLAPGMYCWNACIQYADGAEPWTVLRNWARFRILPG